MPKPQRDPARERFWRDAIAEQRASGRTVRDFCRDRQLTETAFHHWRRELRDRDDARTATPAFVPVTVVPGPIAPNAPGAPNATVEVRCPTGHVVNLTGADAATLRALFAALAGLAEDAPC